MLEALAEAGLFLIKPMSLVVLLGGTVVSVIFGIIPGLSGMIACALALPFLFRMSPEIALTLLIALMASSPTGGSVSAVLINIPGTALNIATTLDGFPMTQKGEGGRALGAAIMSSMAGGVIGVPMSLVMIPLILPIVMAFRSPEMLFVVILGLVSLAGVSGGNALKGMLSGIMGLTAALIGTHPRTGVLRFTYGIVELYDGLGIVPVSLGIFALPQMIKMFMKGQATISQVPVKTKMKDVFQGIKDVFIHRWLFLRCAVIGHIFGILPGVGAETAIWVCYGHAKQISKHPEKFGTGVVEGVIAPETANNVKEAGDLLTTMALGIPGGILMAIFLGAFIMVGVTPGPRMLVDHLPLALTLLLGIVLANIMGGGFCLFTAPYISRVALVHIDFLFPVILVAVFVGAFVAGEALVDIIIVILFGILGYFMDRYGYSRAALVVGFVLGGLFERYLLLSLDIFGPLFFATPISLVLITLIVAWFCYPYLARLFDRLFKLRRVKDEK